MAKDQKVMGAKFRNRTLVASDNSCNLISVVMKNGAHLSYTLVSNFEFSDPKKQRELLYTADGYVLVTQKCSIMSDLQK